MTALVTLSDRATLAAKAAQEIAEHLREAVTERGIAHLALSGGATPERTHESLAASVEDWSAVELWFADERCVAPEDRQSNYRMARETLLARAPLIPAQVHRMQGELGPALGASKYAANIHERIAPDEGGRPVLDVIVLGIGPDGHTASLFPDSDTLTMKDPAICLGVYDAPKPPPERITLSLEVLRAARRCILIVSGSEKARALAAALGNPTPHVPASLLERDRLMVLADAEAAAS